MIKRNKIMLILVIGATFMLANTVVLSQSSQSQSSINNDGNSTGSSQSGSLSRDDAQMNPSNPAIVNPNDPTGVNSNTPMSPGVPPGSPPGMNSNVPSGANPGHSGSNY